ncbi:hypothetical protein BDV96DRAFT_334454 [Lophiotrema nucula]|uniref:Uncharacterized protein n=1 Tax=Lophiotrema nucula TaxID=690887 RepID=A0A6A5YI20_9PLEO|nr:hypothetical protein BDV96DRAFT_334454 [Lophiotrema nucula]
MRVIEPYRRVLRQPISRITLLLPRQSMSSISSDLTRRQECCAPNGHLANVLIALHLTLLTIPRNLRIQNSSLFHSLTNAKHPSFSPRSKTPNSKRPVPDTLRLQTAGQTARKFPHRPRLHFIGAEGCGAMEIFIALILRVGHFATGIAMEMIIVIITTTTTVLSMGACTLAGEKL